MSQQRAVRPAAGLHVSAHACYVMPGAHMKLAGQAKTGTWGNLALCFSAGFCFSAGRSCCGRRTASSCPSGRRRHSSHSRHSRALRLVGSAATALEPGAPCPACIQEGSEGPATGCQAARGRTPLSKPLAPLPGGLCCTSCSRRPHPRLPGSEPVLKWLLTNLLTAEGQQQSQGTLQGTQ